ncbi:restriction endonuclease subunit S [Sulfitobacter sp. S190]|uniref:restriction endonuclease subunit S n=1 Tax=Sulfitobacter sp. S190 TaxID=2867022 RepID=UPI0021A82997|nr:restriction endonuclease subunit S [Sulfitobacter sp. S190]UWR22621.1 restriction endonuclease subunit S [Sulfitobacter sp. S190]
MSVTVDLGELVDRKVVSLQTGPFGSQLHSYDYVEQGVPVVPTEGIQGGRLDHSVLPKISPEKADELARHRLKFGDVLFARRGAQATGRTARVRLGEEDFICGTGAILARIHDKEVLDPDYFAWFLLSSETVEWIREQAIGATMPNLNAGIIKRISLPLPPLPEQREIAGVLGALDDKIEANRKAAACLEEMARALYRSWFVTFDPVHAKSQNRPPAHMDPTIAALFPDRFSENGLPEGWAIDSFSNLFDLISGGTPKTSVQEFWGGSIPWYSVVDAPSDGQVFVHKTEKAITKRGFEKCSAKKVPKGTTIISARGTVGKLAVASEEMVFNQSCYGLRGKHGDFPAFVYFSSMRAVEQLQSMAHGSVFSTITRKTFDGLDLVQPKRQVLDAFELEVGAFLEKILIHGRENQTLATLRDTLLPRLMTGTLRVKAAEAEVEAVL